MYIYIYVYLCSSVNHFHSFFFFTLKPLAGEEEGW